MRVLVCGGRDFDDFNSVNEELTYIAGDVGIDLIMHGGATGADRLAGEWADLTNTAKMIFPANWGKYRKAAGPLRNQQMLDDGKPDLVVAFPGGAGTADMVRRAKAASVPVKEIE